MGSSRIITVFIGLRLLQSLEGDSVGEHCPGRAQQLDILGKGAVALSKSHGKGREPPRRGTTRPRHHKRKGADFQRCRTSSKDDRRSLILRCQPCLDSRRPILVSHPIFNSRQILDQPLPLADLLPDITGTHHRAHRDLGLTFLTKPLEENGNPVTPADEAGDDRFQTLHRPVGDNDLVAGGDFGLDHSDRVFGLGKFFAELTDEGFVNQGMEISKVEHPGHSRRRVDRPKIVDEVESSEKVARKQGLDEPDLSASRWLFVADSGTEDLVEVGKLPQVPRRDVFALGSRTHAIPSGSVIRRGRRHGEGFVAKLPES